MNPIPPLYVALATLDPDNDAHWTADGQARVDVVSKAAGKVLIRQDIIDAAPTFTRLNAPEILAEYRASLGPLAEVCSPPTNPPAPPPREPAPTAAPTAAHEPEAPDPLATRDDPPNATLATLDALTPEPGTTPPCESALEVPMRELMQSVPLLEQALAELNEKSQALLAHASKIKEELKQLYAKSELCTRQLALIRPKNDPANDVQSYLRQSAKAREERALLAQAFIAAGTTAGDVRKQMVGPSPLDAALRQRKPAAGSTRPAARVIGG